MDQSAQHLAARASLNLKGLASFDGVRTDVRLALRGTMALWHVQCFHGTPVVMLLVLLCNGTAAACFADYDTSTGQKAVLGSAAKATDGIGAWRFLQGVRPGSVEGFHVCIYIFQQRSV